MKGLKPPTAEQIRKTQAMYARARPSHDRVIDPRVENLVNDLIGRVADKWTMIILEALTGQSPLRFTRIGREATGISQKMLTQTLRQMERDGLVSRKVYPVIPPRVGIQYYRSGPDTERRVLWGVDMGRRQFEKGGQGPQRL